MGGGQRKSHLRFFFPAFLHPSIRLSFRPSDLSNDVRQSDVRLSFLSSVCSTHLSVLSFVRSSVICPYDISPTSSLFICMFVCLSVSVYLSVCLSIGHYLAKF